MKWSQITTQDTTSGEVVLVDWCKTDQRMDNIIRGFVVRGAWVSMPLHCGDPSYLAQTLIQGKINAIATTQEMWSKILEVAPGLIRKVKAHIIKSSGKKS